MILTTNTSVSDKNLLSHRDQPDFREREKKQNNNNKGQEFFFLSK